MKVEHVVEISASVQSLPLKTDDREVVGQSVRDVVDDLYGALTRGDEAWFRAHLVRGPEAIHIGTAAAYWQTPDDLMKALKRAFAEVPMIWRAGSDMVIGQRGNVAWVADRPQVLFDDGSDFAPRVTIVLVDEGGTWKIAHSHYSSASD
jgi:hypothetical protein